MSASTVTAAQVKQLFASYNGNNINTQTSFIDLVFALSDTPIVAKTANYTLALTDKNSLVTMTVAGANTLTVPPNSSVAFPIGTKIVIQQLGAGQTTITAGAGVTLRSAGGLVAISAQYGQCTLTKIATNTWALVGNLA